MMFNRLQRDPSFYPEFSIGEDCVLREEQIKHGHDVAVSAVESGEALAGLGVVEMLGEKFAGYENLVGLLYG